MYDVIIIGAGPAGLSAAIYTCRSNLKTLVIENESFGGKLTKIHTIDNYPGMPNVDGGTLAGNLYSQAKDFNAEIINEQVNKIIDGEIKEVITDNSSYKTKAIIIASGTKVETLKLDRAKEFVGKGISYCAVCDGFFYRKKDLVVLGDKKEAIEEALFLSDLANSVYIVSKRESLLAEEALINKVNNANNIEVIYKSVPKELIIENETIQGITIENIDNKKTRDLSALGIFPYIGTRPNTDFIDNKVLNDQGYLIVDETMSTRIKGIFGAGDVINRDLKQVVTACSDGAIAASSAKKYINN